MDAEKFDKVVLDLLYDELDELTRASAIRHLEQSGRAKALYAELRATREVGALPLVEPPPDLEERILAAEERVRAGRPLHQRIGTLVSIVASYAMRPQLGMAAVLLLMVGSSLLLLRVKPGEPSSVQVTERGVPESDKETIAVVPAPGSPVPDRGEESAQARLPARTRATEGPRPPEPPADKAPSKDDAPRGGGVEGEVALGAAPSRSKAEELDLADGRRGRDMTAEPSPPTAMGSGAGLAGNAAATDETATEKRRDDCEVTLPRYEAALARAASPIEANRARWGAAECYVRLGRVESARRTYRALLSAPLYSNRAKAALAALPEPAATATAVAAAAPAEAKKGAAKPEPASPPASASAAPER